MKRMAAVQKDSREEDLANKFELRTVVIDGVEGICAGMRTGDGEVVSVVISSSWIRIGRNIGGRFVTFKLDPEMAVQKLDGLYAMAGEQGSWTES